MQRQKRKRKRQLITLSVRLMAALIMSVMLVGIAVVVLLTSGRKDLFIYAEEKLPDSDVGSENTNDEPAMIIIPDDGAMALMQVSASENTVSQDEPATEPIVRIAITEPDGWYSKAVKIKVIAEDIANTGNFMIKTVKARIGQSGSWADITESMYVELTENSTVYVEVADTNGNTYSKNARITCFDYTKPTLNAAVNNGTITVQSADTDSGIKAVYVNGFEFTNLTNGTVNIRMEQFDTGYQYFTVQAMDNAGNMSENYRVNNPYYSTGSSSSKYKLPESAEATKPASSTAKVTDHIKTDNQGNMISANKVSSPSSTSQTGEKKKSLVEADALEREKEYTTVSGQGKEFYTIEAKTGKVFYLIIDRNGDNEEVHFVTDITENDLLNVTEENSETLPRNSATLEAGEAAMESALPHNNNSLIGSKSDENSALESFFAKKTVEDEAVSEDKVSMNAPDKKSEDSEKPEKKGSQTTLYIICLAIALIVVAAAYGLKKLKQNRDGEYDENEDDDPDEGDLPDDDADEDSSDNFMDVAEAPGGQEAET